jgi:hypothetical protein
MSHKPLNVGFVVNQLSIRGTETVAWGYAHYNEIILGNKSIIFVKNRKDAPVDPEHANDNTPEATEWFTKRFPDLYYSPENEIEDLMVHLKIDVCFIEMAGVETDWVPKRIPSVLHCVFQPLLKGTVSTAISEHVARDLLPVLPNIMPMHDTTDDMREELNIPKDAIVFGRYGGYNQFSIEYAKEAIRYVSSRKSNIYFVFMNTKPFMESTKNVIFLDGTRDLYKKRKYINTCDAMLHARDDGETFGAAIAEFAQCDKNIITCTYQMYGNSDQHIRILGEQCITYDNFYHLVDILENYKNYKKDMVNNGYYKYTPDKLMPLFKKFIEEAYYKHSN